MAWNSANNAVLFDGCQKLKGVTVRLSVSEELVTYQDQGFSLQLNAYPPPGQQNQGQSLTQQQVGSLALTWLQYIIYVQNGQAWWEIQYWANNAHSYDAANGQAWPPGYTPNPPNTTPWLPVLPNDYHLTPFGPVPSNRIPAGSELTITLTTDTNSNVTGASFSISGPTGAPINGSFTFPQGAQFPIDAFEVNLVGPGGFSTTDFISGAALLTYSVSAGSLSVQNGGPGTSCGEDGVITGEGSNAVYGTVTPPSGPTVTQPVSFAWQGTPARAGSPLDGYWGSDSSQHVNFLDVNGHVHELYIHPGASWVDNDLTKLASGAPAGAGSTLDGYWGSDSSQHVNFLDASGHVHELYIHPGADWVDNDLTALAKGTPAAAGSPLDGYWGSDSSQHVNFLDASGHVHELYIHPGAGWVDNDLTRTAPNGTPAAPPWSRPGTHATAAGSGLDGYWGSDSSQHVNFADASGHVHELYIHPGAGWVDNNLTQMTGGGTPAAPGSSLHAYWGSDSSQHVNFLTDDGHVHELYIHPGASWVDNDLTALANGTPAAVGSALDGYWGSDSSQHVNFVDVNGHVHELYIHPGAGWVDNDLSGETQ